MKRTIVSLSAALVLSGSIACAENYPADNTGKNVRDKSGGTLTAMDQSESAGDITITQTIRKALVADDGLSTTAHNVKIITINGVVTLRGPVINPEEKASVARKAQQVPGVTRVDNQLEVAGK